MARSYLGLVCAVAVASVCSAKRSNQHDSQQLKPGPFDNFGGGGFGGGGFGGGGFGGGGFGGGGFGDFGGAPGAPEAPATGMFGGSFPDFPDSAPETRSQKPQGVPGFDMGGFDMGFPNNAPEKQPQEQPQGGGAGGGIFPGFDMGGMMDMMGGMMADAMNCAEKEMEVCCHEPDYRKTTCVPLWYCLIAIGERDFGPVPPCDSPVKFGDAKKCKKSEADIKKEMTLAKSMCFDKINKLYDLQDKLGQCAVQASEEKQKVEEERQALESIQHEAEECEKTKAKAKAEKSMGSFTSESQGQGQFCPSFTAELKAAFAAYTLAVEQCISVQVSVSVQIPEINIEIPEIKVGEVQGSSFNVQRPDFNAPDFSGDIIVPGGGGKLNVVPEGHAQHAQHDQQSEKVKLTFDQRVANIKADIKECEDTMPKMAEKKRELAGSKSTVLDQKQKATKSTQDTSQDTSPQFIYSLHSEAGESWGLVFFLLPLSCSDGSRSLSRVLIPSLAALQTVPSTLIGPKP